ncbi:hypothetical protein [Actinocrispum wychmicini]|uniref:hypothetical protein n=1 Tax=Actinocrispum wychmicini TaxID=1213861 RepID=UPI0010495C98|nr:hypothetical protein [Actinocrispum wychmicini]
MADMAASPIRADELSPRLIVHTVRARGDLLVLRGKQVGWLDELFPGNRCPLSGSLATPRVDNGTDTRIERMFPDDPLYWWRATTVDGGRRISMDSKLYTSAVSPISRRSTDAAVNDDNTAHLATCQWDKTRAKFGLVSYQ